MELLKKNIVFTVVMAHAAIAFWHHFHPWISMDAQKDILLKLLANNPGRIDFRVTLRTSWNLVQEQQFRSSSEAEIPQEKLGFPVPPAPTPPLEGGGEGIPWGGGAGGVHGPWTLDHIYVYIYIYIYVCIQLYIYIYIICIHV